MKSSPSKILSKKGWLDFLYYKIGKQQSNFYVCGTYTKNGEKGFTKWKTYLDAVSVIDEVNKNNTWEERAFFNSINQRQILPNEIVLDIEEPGELKPILKTIKGFNWETYSLYETGSRGYHIHLFFNEHFKINEKEAVVKKFGADMQKCSDKNLIALEYCPHWKTGKLKQEVHSI